MSYKKATYVSLVLIIGIALLFIFSSSELAKLQPNQPVSPATFPRIVSGLIIIVSIVSFFTTFRKEDEKVELLNFKYVMMTIIACGVFLILWQLFDLFYVFTFALLTFLFYMYSDSENKRRRLFVSVVAAFVVVLLTYLVFYKLLGVFF